jgi:ataxin-3
MSNNDEFWIYHERQQAALCGQHALNNLVQAAVFNAQGLAEIAMQLDQIELDYMAQNNEGGVKYVSTCFGFNLFCFYMC